MRPVWSRRRYGEALAIHREAQALSYAIWQETRVFVSTLPELRAVIAARPWRLVMWSRVRARGRRITGPFRMFALSVRECGWADTLLHLREYVT